MNWRVISWVGIFSAVLVWSAVAPRDYATWLLEVFPALAGGVVLWLSASRFPLTRLTYILILVHMVILMVGGHYTYAEVPLFDWLRDEFGMARNNYDKLGHLAQGFVPALVGREIVVVKDVFNSRIWRNFFIVCFCLALSAFYELIEWWVALLSEEAADAFLGTQGYVWDTQSDMLLALIGAVLALVLLGRRQDMELAMRGRAGRRPGDVRTTGELPRHS